MNMSPQEAVNAATINGAKAMELSSQLGSITIGKVASLIITRRVPDLAYLPYSFGTDQTETVILRGQIR